MSSSIRDVVFKKAQEEALSILENAKKDAEKIIEESMKRKKEIIEEERNRILREVGVDRRIAEARMKSRQILSSTKNRIIKEVEENVKNLLENMNERNRVLSLQNLVTEAVNELLSNFGANIGKVVIYISKKDRELFKKLTGYLKEKFKGIDIEVKERDMLGGVIVESLDGGIIIDNSYENRLRKALGSSLNEFQRLFEL